MKPMGAPDRLYAGPKIFDQERAQKAYQFLRLAGACFLLGDRRFWGLN